MYNNWFNDFLVDKNNFVKARVDCTVHEKLLSKKALSNNEKSTVESIRGY